MINGFDEDKMFCLIDDFCKKFEPEWHQNLIGQKTLSARGKKILLSEIMFILIWFQLSGSRCFKHFYLGILPHHRSLFSTMVSYSRFVELMPLALLPLVAFFEFKKGSPDGNSFMDATPLAICHNKRISANKVFTGKGAKMGKSTMGWFFGFKLHIVINTKGEILSASITPGNVDDRKPVRNLTKNLFGKIFADKGYISQKLFEELYERGLKLVTGLKKNMKQKIMEIGEKLMLRKRSLVESAYHVLKNVCHIDHTRHRSPVNFMVNLMAGLCAYCLHQGKPKLRTSDLNSSLPLCA